MSITHPPQAGPDLRDPATVVRAVTTAIEDLTGRLVQVPGAELSGMAGAVIALRAQTEGLLAAITLEAAARAVIASADARTVTGWLTDAADTIGVPLTRHDARILQDVVDACALPMHTDPDEAVISPLREAVISGTLPLAAAGLVATEFAKVHRDITPARWHATLTGMIQYAASGATRTQMIDLRDVLISHYGTATTFEEKAAASYRRRDLTGFHRTRHGDYQATLTLDPASHAIVAATLEALSAPNPTRHTDPDRNDPDSADPDPGHADPDHAVAARARDPRTPGQRRADALVDLCRNAAATGRHPRTHLVVTMDYDNLRDQVRFGLTTHGQPLTPQTVRQHACDARIIPMVLGSQGEVLNVGRAARLATAAQLTALRHRDRGCTFPGCDRPPTWTDAHHLHHWIDGGDTDLPNLALLCRHHHTIVHRHHYTATITNHRVTWNTDPPDATWGNAP